MATADTLEGGCLCGVIRYRISGPPRLVPHCHCSMCRRASGAPVVTWVTVRESAFTPLAGELRWYQSSDHGKRGFCADCGTQILFSSTHYAGWVDVTAASLDRPEAVKPTSHTYEPDRIPWLVMADTLPRHVEDSRSPTV